MIEKSFNIPFVARLAQREKQIQQAYRPIIGVHKWFARRPGTLFRALLLSEFADDKPLDEAFYSGHNLGHLTIGDPFMGGGTPLLEANRLGCHIVGTDVNPMAYWIVRQEIARLDTDAFLATARQVTDTVERQIGDLYQTTCIHCGNTNAQVKYFLWVKQQACDSCRRMVDLFSSYVVAKNQRHPNHVLVCPSCGVLNQVHKLDKSPGGMLCTACHSPLRVDGPAKRNYHTCPHCGHTNSYPGIGSSPPAHRLYAMEYHCATCKPSHQGRFFKSPDQADLSRYEQAEQRLRVCPQTFVPQERIPAGDETARLHRWGYTTYKQLFNARQLLGLETLAQTIATVDNTSVRHALLTVFSDTLRYQNMLCRYDSWALKVIDIFSVHGFPVGLAQCENTLLGISKIGSGGFRHFVNKYAQAKAYCEKPFETWLGHQKKRRIYIQGEQIRAVSIDTLPPPNGPKTAFLKAEPAENLEVPPASLDAVLTDPPYFANVQYAELMDFCYVWLRKHLAGEFPAFLSNSTRTDRELTVNATEGRDIHHFAEGLSHVFGNFTQALKPGAAFAFTYHHNDIQAYYPIAMALLDSRLVCTAALPCPAEMSASIHINGTKSSVLDTILVCRTTGTLYAPDFEMTLENLERMLTADLESLQRADLSLTLGDALCLLYGHLVRLAIWKLRPGWKKTLPSSEKLIHIRQALQEIYPLDLLTRLANKVLANLSDEDPLATMRVKESRTAYEVKDELSF